MADFDEYDDEIEEDEDDDLFDEDDDEDDIPELDEYEDELKEMIADIAAEFFDVDLEDYEDAVDEIYELLEETFSDYLEENTVYDSDDLPEDEEVQEAVKDGIRDYLEDNYIGFPDLKDEKRRPEESPAFLGAFGSMLEMFTRPDDKKTSSSKKDYDRTIDDFEDDMEGFAHEYRDDFDSLSEAMDLFEDELEIKKRRK